MFRLYIIIKLKLMGFPCDAGLSHKFGNGLQGDLGLKQHFLAPLKCRKLFQCINPKKITPQMKILNIIIP